MFGTPTAIHTVFNPTVEVNTSVENRTTCSRNFSEIAPHMTQKCLTGDPEVLRYPTLLDQFGVALITASHCIPLGKL